MPKLLAHKGSVYIEADTKSKDHEFEPKVKYNRAKYNRLSGDEQAAYEKKADTCKTCGKSFKEHLETIKG